MTPRSPVQTDAPSSEEAARCIEERNVAQLSLISIYERIPDEYLTWTQKVLSDQGEPEELKCDAMPQYGSVPHGIDNDVTAAILRYFIEAGCPADGTVTFAAHDLLKQIGAHLNGGYCKQLNTSLYRLRTATFNAKDVWRTSGTVGNCHIQLPNRTGVL